MLELVSRVCSPCVRSLKACCWRDEESDPAPEEEGLLQDEDSSSGEEWESPVAPETGVTRESQEDKARLAAEWDCAHHYQDSGG